MRDPYQNIAVVTTSYPSHERDWVGHFVRQEVLELAQQARVTVFTTRAAFSTDDGVRVRVLGGGAAFGAPGALARIAEFPPRAASACAWVARVSSALRRETFDRVIVHWALPVALAVPNVELVSHGSDARLLAKLPMRSALASALVSDARSWRFVSTALRDHLVDALAPNAARQVVEKSFVRAASMAVPDVRTRADALRAALGAFDVCVGRLVPAKRIDKAIDRAARTRELLVVVGDGPERASLERRAAKKSARVRFVGELPRDEALAYLAAARLLVFASDREGCSTVLREAHALSTPVARV